MNESVKHYYIQQQQKKATTQKATQHDARAPKNLLVGESNNPKIFDNPLHFLSDSQQEGNFIDFFCVVVRECQLAF